MMLISSLIELPIPKYRCSENARCQVANLDKASSRVIGFVKSGRNFDISTLSDRELEIFSFIGRGVTTSELANELNVSVKTIETHQMRMKEKLGVQSAAELRQKAREWLARSALNRIREEPELEPIAERAFL
jgi:DNA-binding CsgD family transcriptional regulator